MEMGLQIGLREGGPVFVGPQPLFCLGMLNGGKFSGGKGNVRAFPFPAAAVAEKAERKTAFAGMVGCFFGKRGAQCRTSFFFGCIAGIRVKAGGRFAYLEKLIGWGFLYLINLLG
jgi:hypothetical protein